ncbi:MAG: lytic transglycosylase domain-containing protein [Armatimonadota bacterium]
MVRRAGNGVVVALLLSACVSAASAAEGRKLSASARRYVATRAETKAVVDLSLRDLKARLLDLGGKVVELSGTITGILSRSGQSVEGKKAVTFLLKCSQQGGSLFVDCGEGIPEVRGRNQVRILTRLDADEPTLARVPLLAIVSERDLPASWQKPDREAPPPAGGNAPSGAAGGAAVPSGTPGVVPPQSISMGGSRPGTTQPVQPPRPSADWYQRALIAYKDFVASFNEKLTDQQLDLIVRSVLKYSADYGLDHRLVFALLAWESSFNPRARSHKGAMGLGQLMPGTAKALGVTNAYDIEQNIRGSVRYLADQVRRYQGRSNRDQFMLAIACYNAGPGRVAAAGHKVPKIAETIRHVNRVGGTWLDLHQKGYP